MMKVNIRHVQKKQGLLFATQLHGVELAVEFSNEEKAIIKERKLEQVILLDREVPPDVDEEKHANRGLMKQLATAAIKGSDANHFGLTFNKLLNGPDTYFFLTPIEAKGYEDILKQETLPDAKAYLDGNKETGTSDSFEL